MDTLNKIIYQMRNVEWKHPFVSKQEMLTLLSSARFFKWYVCSYKSQLVIALPQHSIPIQPFSSQENNLRRAVLAWATNTLRRGVINALEVSIAHTVVYDNTEGHGVPGVLTTPGSRRDNPQESKMYMLQIAERNRTYIREAFLKNMIAGEEALIKTLRAFDLDPIKETQA